MRFESTKVSQSNQINSKFSYHFLFLDGVTVVLYHTMEEFMIMSEISVEQYVLAIIAFFVVTFGSMFIGITFGVLSALMTKVSHEVRGLYQN